MKNLKRDWDCNDFKKVGIDFVDDRIWFDRLFVSNDKKQSGGSMTFTLWRCKRLTKRIWKLEDKQKRFRDAIKIIDKWIKQDKKKMNNLLKSLSDEENLEYGLQMGLINNADYQIINHEKKNKKLD